MGSPYPETEALLRSAYRVEAKHPVAVQNFIHTTGKSLTSRLDSVAQSAMIIGVVERTLPVHHKHFIVAYHTHPTSAELLLRKQYSITSLVIGMQRTVHYPTNYVLDVVAGWAFHESIPRGHDDQWWSEQLGVSKRTLRYWKRGRGRQVGIAQFLEEGYWTAMGHLADEFRRRKVVSD